MKTLLIILSFSLMAFGHEAGPAVYDCSPETLGQLCSLESDAGELIGKCEWKKYHILPSCSLVSDCTPESVGASCVNKEKKIGQCVWQKYHALPNCEV